MMWSSGGEMAKGLSGLYTSEREAKEAVKAWSDKQPPSRKKTIEVVIHGSTED